jgi:hypothetical protein
MDIYTAEQNRKIQLRTLEVKIAERIFNIDCATRTDACGNILSANFKSGDEEVLQAVPFYTTNWEDCRQIIQAFVNRSLDTKAGFMSRLHVYASRRAGENVNPGISVMACGWLTCEDICNAALDVLDGVTGPLPELECVF